LTRIPRTENKLPSVVCGKTARSVEVLLSAIQAAVRNSLSSVKNGTARCAQALHQEAEQKKGNV
jgi:hypothetical protein